MGRAPCCDKANVKRGPWSPDEDTTLKNYVERHGTGGNWISLPQKAGLKRCGKSCRLRWLNYLRPDIKHGGFTEEEDDIICSLYNTLGSRWSVIASHLQGRTDNDVKNHWNTKLKKKLMASTAISLKAQAANQTALSSSAMAINNPKNLQYNWAQAANASTLLTETAHDLDYNWDFDQKPFACPNPFLLPAPAEMSDMSSSLTNYSISSSSQDASGSTTPLAADNGTFKWAIGGGELDSLMMEFSYGSQFGLGSYICPPEKLGELTPCPSYLSYHTSPADTDNKLNAYQPRIMY